MTDFMRRSPDGDANKWIVDTGVGLDPQSPEARSNVAWLARQKVRSGVLLLGGITIDHFRVRVAQSRYRDDLAPSLWSMVGILLDSGIVMTVPIDRLPDASKVPLTNAVHRFDFSLFDSAERFPNIAVLSFADDLSEVEAAAVRIEKSRAILDLPSMLIAWLSYVWATDASSNPLAAGVGLPSAAFVETAFASCQVEISPGQRTASSSPEAIWQAARWWSGFYKAAKEHHDKTIQPSGAYRISQWAAAALGARDNIEGNVIRPSQPASATRAPAARQRRAPAKKK